VCNPAKEDIFNAFWACPFDKVKAVFLFIVPVLNKGKADRLALSAPPGKKRVLTIKHMAEGLKANVCSGDQHQDERSPILLIWAKQGVLLLNRYLTAPCEGGETNTWHAARHRDMWDDLVANVIDGLSDEKLKRGSGASASPTEGFH
jgi:uracil-DNA glycosylase